jgi:ElaB/YqjD/DUF883 family membrane-anchored ribosome-binding protein
MLQQHSARIEKSLKRWVIMHQGLQTSLIWRNENHAAKRASTHRTNTACGAKNIWLGCDSPQTHTVAVFRFKASLDCIERKVPMSDSQTVTAKMSALGARLSHQVEGLTEESKPAYSRMSHCVQEELQGLGESGKEALSDVKHKLEKEAQHARSATESLIQHDPIRSVLIAASTGAGVALLASWLMRTRPH